MNRNYLIVAILTVAAVVGTTVSPVGANETLESAITDEIEAEFPDYEIEYLDASSACLAEDGCIEWETTDAVEPLADIVHQILLMPHGSERSDLLRTVRRENRKELKSTSLKRAIRNGIRGKTDRAIELVEAYKAAALDAALAEQSAGLSVADAGSSASGKIVGSTTGGGRNNDTSWRYNANNFQGRWINGRIHWIGSQKMEWSLLLNSRGNGTHTFEVEMSTRGGTDFKVVKMKTECREDRFAARDTDCDDEPRLNQSSGFNAYLDSDQFSTGDQVEKYVEFDVTVELRGSTRDYRMGGSLQTPRFTCGRGNRTFCKFPV